MIICVCQSVSDREVRAAIRNGVTSLEQLQLELGVASGCGKCTNAVCEMLIQTRRCTGKEEAHARPPQSRLEPFSSACTASLRARRIIYTVFTLVPCAISLKKALEHFSLSS